MVSRLELHYFSLVLMIWSLLFCCSDSVPEISPPDSEDPYGRGWSATHADGANSDFSKIPVPRNVALSWLRKFDGTINLGASSGKDGTIYITTTAAGCHLYALDPKTGETKWCSENVSEFAVASGVLVDSDQRLFIADEKKMVALDKLGNVTWTTNIDGFPFSAQFTQTGRLIFITHVGTIYVLDRKTGTPVLPPKRMAEGIEIPNFDPRACMRGTKDCPAANTLAFDLATGQMYFTFWFSDQPVAALVAMRYTESPGPSLQYLWQNDMLPGGSASSPDISADGNTVYVNDNVNAVHAIDTRTGNLRWSFNIGYAPGGSQSISPEGYIFPGGGDGAKLMCLRDEGSHASLVWKSGTLQNRGIVTQTTGNMAIATAKVGTLAYELIICDVKDGKIFDRVALPGKPLFSVGTTIGQDSSILVPTFNGYLYSFKGTN